MKKTSIVFRITCWYAAFILIIMAGFSLLQFEFESSQAEAEARTSLGETVSEAGEFILEEGTTYAISSYMSFYKDDIYLSVYDENGDLIEGRRPPRISAWPAFRDKGFQRCFDDNRKRWFLYDNQIKVDDQTIWVRGMKSSKSVYGDSRIFFPYMMAVLIFLVILSITGGYLISKQAFSPVRSLISMVQKVSNDQESVHHIPSNSQADEIGMLTEEFNQMFDRLSEQQEREKRFTSDVSHELKTPLSVILAQCDYAAQDSSYQEEALVVIRRNASSMSTLVSTLLLLSRGDAGRLSLQSEPVDLSMLCHMVADQQEEELLSEQITLSRDITPDIIIEGDETLLMQIPINLITNARKYGKHPDGHIALSLSVTEDVITLSVKDDGPGIPQEHQQKIFDRFYTVNESRTGGGSSGLGLSIVKMIAGYHGGWVSLESTLGKGSCFMVMFPVKECSHEA